MGSSPLARGTPSSDSDSTSSARFIPARAGNTVRSTSHPRGLTVHPRSRGEHLDIRQSLPDPGGSSPLARGTRATGAPHQWSLRFIPARAGNTPIQMICRGGRPVHPRSRGEHSIARNVAASAGGSSPLARGTHLDADAHGGWRRFIPARAGNTPTSSPSRQTATVHPRSRGEHSRTSVSGLHSSGSSPLARGTRSQFDSGQTSLRFIPARAGNTHAAAARPCR